MVSCKSLKSLGVRVSREAVTVSCNPLKSLGAKGVCGCPPILRIGGVVHPTPLHERVTDLGNRVARLSVSHRDPERFHLDKSDLAHELRLIAKELKHG